MKLSHSLAALSLALLAGTAFAATTPAAPAAGAAAPAAKAAAPAKAKTLHCKKGETAVKGKCEKAKPKG